MPKNFKKFISVLTKLKILFFNKQCVVSCAENCKIWRVFWILLKYFQVLRNFFILFLKPSNSSMSYLISSACSETKFSRSEHPPRLADIDWSCNASCKSLVTSLNDSLMDFDPKHLFRHQQIQHLNNLPHHQLRTYHRHHNLIHQFLRIYQQIP